MGLPDFLLERMGKQVPHLRFKELGKAGILLLMLAAYIFLAYSVSRHHAYYDPYSLSGNDKISFEKARVTSVNSEDIKPDEAHSGLFAGSQNLTVQILTGEFRGRSYPVLNNLNYDTNFVLKPGQSLIVSVSVTGDGKTVNINPNSPDRAPFLYVMAALFILLLCLTGGKSGFHSAIGIGFTMTSVLFLFIPLLYRGVPPVAASVIFAAATSCVTLTLVGGLELKSLVAFLGTLGGVAVSAGIELLFNELTGTSGYTFSDTDSLLAIASHSRLQVGGLFFAAVLIASLGAVMDVAISVATSVNEVYRKDPDCGGRALFRCGMNVGRDMMGTMANTLILAFTGSSLVILIQIYTYNMPYYQVMNSNNVAAEMIQALAGSTAVILTVPAVAFLSAKLLPMLGKKQVL